MGDAESIHGLKNISFITKVPQHLAGYQYHKKVIHSSISSGMKFLKIAKAIIFTMTICLHKSWLLIAVTKIFRYITGLMKNDTGNNDTLVINGLPGSVLICRPRIDTVYNVVSKCHRFVTYLLRAHPSVIWKPSLKTIPHQQPSQLN